MKDWTDEEIWERACAERGCTNLSERGYSLCGGHLYGWKPEKLPEAAAKRKLEMEQEKTNPDSVLGMLEKAKKRLSDG